ncbi:TonB-dependent receptor [Phenylobacterium montanum]|uniref:TonB-dependent receptor n=1 Tax=Phenylobacterium montanum TaxID=2823693 RepID=A0A975ITW8_9CAUL|nr:TonB-dependent receptor [Caulobacter sp. S6]QUD87317.1 TonB-dependent receptor [Caulobacter sp. S6]
MQTLVATARRAALALGASLPALMAATFAHAQSAPPAKAASAQPETIESIVVTAQRREETANKIGMAIQAFRGAELTQLHVTSTKDLSAVAPSFTVSQGYEGVPIYTLRGIGFNTINLSATSTVGTYTDEVAYPYPFMNTGPIFDLQRVEVLKGPQGTLYGRNATAGLIDFITNKPSESFAAGATAEIGNYQTHNFEGFVSGPLMPGVQGRLAFRTENSDEGWQVSDTRPGDRQGRVSRYGWRASLAAEPTSKLRIDASFSGWHNGSDTTAAQAIGFTPNTDPAAGGAFSPFNTPGLAAYIASHAPSSDTQADWEPAAQRSANVGTGTGVAGPLRENDDFYAVKLRLDYSLGDNAKLVSLTGYNDLTRHAAFDWSGAPYELLVQQVDGTIRSISEDVHLEGDTRLGHWLVGGYYGHDSITDGDRTLLGENANVTAIRLLTLYGGGPIPAGGLVASPFNTFGYTAQDVAQAFRTYSDIGDLDTDTWSLFANADWRLTDALKLTTGIRYTDDRQTFRGCSFAYNGNLLPTVNLFNRFLYGLVYGGGNFPAAVQPNGCVSFDPPTNSFGLVRSKLDETNVAGRVSLDWTIKPGVLAYAAIARGAKAGDTPINAANIDTSDAPARQELLTGYEVGVKALLADRRLQVNASIFYNDYKDKQLSGYFADPIYTALARLVNIPKSQAYGIDSDVTWRVTHSLTATASVTYLQTEVQKYVGINAAGLPQNFAGAQFPLSPTWQTSLTLLYDHPINDAIGLQAALNGRYQSRSHADLGEDPLFGIKGYGLLNASVGIHALNDRWEFMIWDRNITDAYYWTAVASNANSVVRFPGQPTTFGASLSFKY